MLQQTHILSQWCSLQKVQIVLPLRKQPNLILTRVLSCILQSPWVIGNDTSLVQSPLLLYENGYLVYFEEMSPG